MTSDWLLLKTDAARCRIRSTYHRAAREQLACNFPWELYLENLTPEIGTCPWAGLDSNRS